MARPRKQDDDKLSETARFRLTLAEREWLRNQARSAGLTETEFMRRRILDRPVTTSAAKSVDPALIVAINRVGNNVNQLARSVHRGRDFQNYWQEVGDDLRRVLHRALDGISA